MDEQRLAQIQTSLREQKIDGWLFYDFRGSNPIAYTVLGVNPQQTFTRRWYYVIPAQGDPVKLVNAIEAGNLDELVGTKIIYRNHHELADGLATVLSDKTRLAMEYSPMGELPVLSRVDAGTVEYLRAQGKEIVSSANIVQEFEATWSPELFQTHLEAERRLQAIMKGTIGRVRAAFAVGETLTEYSLQQDMLALYKQHDLFCDHGPIVAVGPNSGNPHYEPHPTNSATIREGDLLLIDWWGKLPQPGAVYADYTWVAVVGREVPPHYQKIFEIVRDARDLAVEFVRDRVRQNVPVYGWQVDEATRAYITQRGYGEAFIHRTGHSIGTTTHGNGANLDNFETKDQRRLLPRTCFSVEPGIYLPEFGIRSEVNVFLSGNGDIEVTGRPIQHELPALLVN